jgi:signal transduction histidine kinase
VGIANKAKSNSSGAGMPEIASSAQVIVSAANQIYDGMHNIVRQLRPGSLDNLGLAETLKDAVSNYQAQYPDIKIQLHLSQNLESGNLDSGRLETLGETVSINLYRIVQESLNNAFKYANATEINIGLTKSATGELLLTIQDNGIGMDVESVDQATHFGLLGMRERAQALNGTFNIISAPTQGTVINITVPHASSN